MNWRRKLCCCLQQHAFGALVLLLILAWGIATWFLSVDFKEGIGLFGSVASLLGLLYTVIQLLKTKTISEETKEAANDAVDRLRTSEYRFAVTKAKSSLREIQTYLDRNEWKFAALRLRDLGEACSTLAFQGPEVDTTWKKFTENANYWATTFVKGNSKTPPEFDSHIWSEFYLSIQMRVDTELSPFSYEVESTDE